MPRRRRFFRVLGLMLILLVFLGTTSLFARAGGAGGSSGSSSHSSSSHSSSRHSGSSHSSSSHSGGGGGGDITFVFEIVYIIVRTLGPLPTFIISAVVIVGGVFLVRRSSRLSGTAYRNIKTPPSRDKVKGLKRFLEETPDFNEEEFLGKVSTAFYAIQEAWSAKDLSKVRRYISDGVYQRFNTQFKMMELLRQRNELSDVQVQEIFFDKVDRDGAYDIIHVGIQASLQDEFVCGLNPALDSGGYEEFLEYWSFLRRRGVPKKDLYDSQLCPSCSAPLPDNPGEVARCGYCGALVNSGEFDWVLSEITQADDYSRSSALNKSHKLAKKTAVLAKEYGDFSVQLLEDKASNGYLQVLTAFAHRAPAIMRRFVSDQAFDKIRGRFPDSQIVFNRLYLNSVTLIGAFTRGEENTLAFSITSSFQRASLEQGPKCRLLDPTVVMSHEVLLMTRHIEVVKSKGSLYLHQCSACGAPIKDTLDITCSYCGNAFNNNRREWIITDLLSTEEYRTFLGEEVQDFQVKLDPRVLDDLFDVKDYALNNIMIIVSADGDFSEEEEDFAIGLAKRWGYNPEKLKPIFRLAAAGRLVIRMPDNPKKRAEIYGLMEKAALVDDDLSEAEQRILDYVKETYLSGGEKP